MFAIDGYERLYVLTAFLFQFVLVIHFALRKWHFDLAMRYGPIVYALSLPAACVSLNLLSAHKPWWLWVGGFIYLLWAIYGYSIEYIHNIEWRSPIRWQYFGPYVTLYLATVMFYWWPLATIYKPLWYVCALLFITSTVLNITSHHKRNLIIKESQA